MCRVGETAFCGDVNLPFASCAKQIDYDLLFHALILRFWLWGCWSTPLNWCYRLHGVKLIASCSDSRFGRLEREAGASRSVFISKEFDTIEGDRFFSDAFALEPSSRRKV